MINNFGISKISVWRTWMIQLPLKEGRGHHEPITSHREVNEKIPQNSAAELRRFLICYRIHHLYKLKTYNFAFSKSFFTHYLVWLVYFYTGSAILLL